VTIWADADSMPVAIRSIISRRCTAAADENKIRAVFVSNKPVPMPSGKYIKAVIVGKAAASILGNHSNDDSGSEPGPDNADDYIMLKAVHGDIVITRDIPLAKKLVEKGIMVINDRGAIWTMDTIKERNSIRDHITDLRKLGLAPGMDKAKNFGPKEVKAFADAFDKAVRLASKIIP